MAIIGFIVMVIVALYFLYAGIMFTLGTIALEGKPSAMGVVFSAIGGFIGYYAYLNAPFSIIIK